MTIVRAELKDNEFLKLYQMQNGTHESDREKATSIVKNLRYNRSVIKSNPFFNKKAKEEPDIDLKAKDLYSMA